MKPIAYWKPDWLRKLSVALTTVPLILLAAIVWAVLAAFEGAIRAGKSVPSAWRGRSE